MKNNYLKHLFTLLLLLCATIASAHDFEVNGIYYNILSGTDKTVEVTYEGISPFEYSNEYSGNVVIPESVNYNGKTYSVTSIGDYAFLDCSGLTNIVIGNSVTSIVDQAFYYCDGLTSITIPNSVTSIGYEAFDSCTGLTSITIPNSVTFIGARAFSECRGLEEVHISDITAWCGIDFNDISANPFYYVGNLYLNGELVTEVVIPEGVKEIKNFAFYRCTSLTSIVIPSSVTSIGESAFFNCSGLTNVEIGNSVTSIGDYAFEYCSGLTSVEIPNSVTSIGNYAFNGTAWYNNQPDGVVYAGKVLYEYKGTMPSNTSITIKEGTLGIADNAFEDCTGLTSITIPNSVTSIGEEAFRSCSSLASITIPNCVTSIGDEAFYYCTGLTSVTSLIPADELFAIDSYVFYNVDKTTCTLYVPYGAKETYAATTGWNVFTNIVEMAPESQPGDINKDGEVNVGDFAALANIIINSESIDDAIKSVSDINADGEVNVGDFAALVNLIFNSGSQASPQ